MELEEKELFRTFCQDVAEENGYPRNLGNRLYDICIEWEKAGNWWDFTKINHSVRAAFIINNVKRYYGVEVMQTSKLLDQCAEKARKYNEENSTNA